MERLTESLVEWAVASRPMKAAAASGDAFLVRELPSAAMVAVVDGLGHGDAAAMAARRALASLREGDEEPVAMLQRCHEALRSTRGVVLDLVRFDATRDLMTRIGVGTIQGILLHADRHASPRERMLFRQGGVLGRQLPSLRTEVLAVGPGDTLILSTDGIHHAFTEGLTCAGPLQPKVDRILARHWNKTDDALVVAVRYRRGLP
jgi:serine phosphatase RsbU (regulator of sigma subunit)